MDARRLFANSDPLKIINPEEGDCNLAVAKPSEGLPLATSSFCVCDACFPKGPYSSTERGIAKRTSTLELPLFSTRASRDVAAQRVSYRPAMDF